MTRKDYVALSLVLETAKLSHVKGDYMRGWMAAREMIAKGIAKTLESENPNFDKDRFLKACGVEE